MRKRFWASKFLSFDCVVVGPSLIAIAGSWNTHNERNSKFFLLFFVIMKTPNMKDSPDSENLNDLVQAMSLAGSPDRDEQGGG